MTNLKKIIKRAMKHGFDLSFIRNYNEKAIFQGLYEYLLKNRYYCSMEDGVIYVGLDIIEDVAEVRIENETMKVTPLTDKGFFDVLVTLFKYISHVAALEEEKGEEDISTEDAVDDDESSEDLWL
jgi:hypothetical protein